MARPSPVPWDLVVKSGVNSFTRFSSFTPGPLFAEVLAYTHKLRLAGRPKEEQRSCALALLRKQNKGES